MVRCGHLITQPGHDFGVDTSPAGMGDAYRVISMKDHSEAISGEHRERETRRRGPKTVGFTCITGAFDPGHVVPVNLAGGGPFIIDSRSPSKVRTRRSIVTDVAV